MGDYAVAITKRTLWHGRQEEFDNVYYYLGPDLQLGDANLERLVKRVAEAERAVHGAQVEFVSGRIWSSGGTVVQNITLGLYDLDGFGTFGPEPIFKEAGIVVEWECSRPNVLGRKVYLRKFIRPGSVTLQMGTDTRTGVAPLNADVKATLKTYADAVQRPDDPAAGVVWRLVSPTGRAPRSDGNGVVNDYMRSREFRRN